MNYFRWLVAALLTLVFVTASGATVNRQLPTSTTDPGGISGSSYADQVAEEVEALWRLGVEPLASVAGTNTITATPLVSTTGFAAYETGNKFSFIAAATNTGAVTINIASRGAKSIKTAAGNALSGGEIVSGTLYAIEYDGTDFRLSASDYDLGSGINGSTAKSTAVDADEFVLSDSAASNVAKKITLSELRSSLEIGWKLVSTSEPTSDVTTITKTGMSAYRDVKVVFIIQVNASAVLGIEARASGGTWRQVLSFGSSGGQAVILGEAKLYNFGLNNSMKITLQSSGAAFGTIDRSNNVANLTSAVTTAGYSSYTEQWDEIRFSVSASTIEGSDSNQRSRVEWYGQGDGD